MSSNVYIWKSIYVAICINTIRKKIKMGKLNIKLKDTIDEKFRREVFRRKGMKKGNLTKAVEEAMILWINVPTKSDNSENARANKE